MYHHAHPTLTTKEFDAIRNILNPFPAIKNQIQTCEELVRSIKGMRMQNFQKSCIAKWNTFGKRVNEKHITEADLGQFEAFLQTKIAEYTKKHEAMLAEGKRFTPRDLKFVPMYHEVAKKYLQEHFTYKQLDEHISNTKRQCRIAHELLGACDEIFFTRFPNTYETFDAFKQVRRLSRPCSATKLIAYALQDHPGRPCETVKPGSDGLSILAAAATSAEEASAAAESRFEAYAAADSRFEATAELSHIDQLQLSYIEQGVLSLDLDPMDIEATVTSNDGTESGGFGREQPASPSSEGELPLLPFTTFAECGFESIPHFTCPWGS
jgi:hypothetical protein